MLEARKLHYFTVLAETLNFRRAAELLHISQPPLSKHIQDLEAELGVALFERSRRAVSLTPEGQFLLERAAPVIRDLGEIEASVKRFASGEAGTLALGFISIADYSFLPAALNAFKRAHPSISLQLRELTSDVQVRELAAGRLDVGVALAPVDTQHFHVRRIQREKLVLALPAAHPLAKSGKAIDMRGLRDERFVLVPEVIAPLLHATIMRLCERHGFVPSAAQEAVQMQTVVSLVSSGLGVAVVPESIVNLKRTGVTYRPISGKASTIEVVLVWPRVNTKAAALNFVRTVEKTVAAAKSAV